MKAAFERFRRNLSYVRHLGAIHNALEAQTTAVLDLSDILRAQLVMAVSALDHYVHEVVRLGMLEIYRGCRRKTPGYLQFSVTLQSVGEVLSVVGSDEWLDGEIRLRHGWQSFQKAERIADAIRLISDKPLWEEVAHHLGNTSQNVKQRLNLIVDRRNKIAHEADIDPTFPDSRWPIDAALVTQAVDFLEQVAESIYRIVG